MSARPDLFFRDTPPANQHEARTSVGCVYDALVSVACRRWQWKREIERMADGLLLGRTAGARQQELESLGRNVRHVRARLMPLGWTVLDVDGHLCLCQQHEEPEMLTMLHPPTLDAALDAAGGTI